MAFIIADSGSTKCEWRVVGSRSSRAVFTQGISPYFLNALQIEDLLRDELLPYLKGKQIDAVYYYGTGCKDPVNAKMIKKVISHVLQPGETYVSHDLMGAARGLCIREKGIACILGTGSNSCYYDGKRIVYNSPGLGYVLGDEGSGAYLGKKVIQYYLYNTFEKDLIRKFDEQYQLSAPQILENVYRKPLPNRYLAGFSLFLSQNRGHYMIENIIEDGINDFFFHHIRRYRESARYPVHFIGGIAHHFQDVIKSLCTDYQLKLGGIDLSPMDGLVKFHKTGTNS
ncbi:MAG: N-acetylglucosamine kinase [Flavitalea sp.]